MSVNKVILIGNLGKDPETFTFDNGNKKVSFSLATSESYKDKEGNKVDKTEWHNITIFGKLADICEKYLSKGSQIYLEGKITTREWEKDGVKRYSTEIIGFNMTMLSKNESTQETAQEIKPKVEPIQGQDAEDDLPF